MHAERERKSKELKLLEAKISELKTQKSGLEERKKMLSEQKSQALEKVSDLNKELKELSKKCGLESQDLSKEALENKLKEIEEGYTNKKAQLASLEEEVSLLIEDKSAIEMDIARLNSNIKSSKETKENIEKELKKELVGLSEADIKMGMENIDRLSELEVEINNFKSSESALTQRLEEIEEEIEKIGNLAETKDVEEEIRRKEEDINAVSRQIGRLEEEKTQIEESLGKKDELNSQILTLKDKIETLKEMKNHMASDEFPEFISSMLMNDLVSLANGHMLRLSAGSYSMEFSGENIIINDRINETKRDIKTLSGGETFLASLSLAFALSDMISAESAIECLFIDEGFGTLDKNARERVGEFLGEIRQNANRVVGIITHMEDIAELFSKRILVKKTKDGSKLECEPETAIIDKPFEFSLS
ncbi:MAG: SbcC/MukB-like Walker B domain-containing protein [Aquificaceae bacterium]|nr:SbcC/MukB-like Walker B domain-containing protein [Aquificaceae bacterium]